MKNDKNNKNKKISAPKPRNDSNQPTDDNSRFSAVFSDPKFARIPKKLEKIEIKDDRFKSMFTDKKFNYSTATDERGFKTKKGITDN